MLAQVCVWVAGWVGGLTVITKLASIQQVLNFLTGTELGNNININNIDNNTNNNNKS